MCVSVNAQKSKMGLVQEGEGGREGLPRQLLSFVRVPLSLSLSLSPLSLLVILLTYKVPQLRAHLARTRILSPWHRFVVVAVSRGLLRSEFHEPGFYVYFCTVLRRFVISANIRNKCWLFYRGKQQSAHISAILGKTSKLLAQKNVKIQARRIP